MFLVIVCVKILLTARGLSLIIFNNFDFKRVKNLQQRNLFFYKWNNLFDIQAHNEKYSKQKIVTAPKNCGVCWGW